MTTARSSLLPAAPAFLLPTGNPELETPKNPRRSQADLSRRSTARRRTFGTLCKFSKTVRLDSNGLHRKSWDTVPNPVGRVAPSTAAPMTFAHLRALGLQKRKEAGGFEGITAANSCEHQFDIRHSTSDIGFVCRIRTLRQSPGITRPL
jgi:hypothetical protein